MWPNEDPSKMETLSLIWNKNFVVLSDRAGGTFLYWCWIGPEASVDRFPNHWAWQLYGSTRFYMILASVWWQILSQSIFFQLKNLFLPLLLSGTDNLDCIIRQLCLHSPLTIMRIGKVTGAPLKTTKHSNDCFDSVCSIFLFLSHIIMT